MPQRIKFWASESCTHTYFVSTISSWPHCKLSIIIFLVDWFQYSVFSFDNNYLHLYFMLYNLIRVIVSLHTLSCTHHMWTKIVTSSHNLSSKTAMCIIDATQLIISSLCFALKILGRRRAPTLFKNWIVDFTQNIWKSMFGAANWEQKIFVWKSTINKHMELCMCSVLTIISKWKRRAIGQLAFLLFQL